MNVLGLFSGIGGIELGLQRAGFNIAALCERDAYCQAVLRKHWPHVPIYPDVRELRARDVPAVRVICGGFPCQPYSVAGKRLGREDDRALWPEYRRLIEETGADWVLGENVVGLVGLELDNVLADLEALGYAWSAFDIPACALGAEHERRRIIVVAHSNRSGLQGRSDAEEVEGEGAQRIELTAGFSAVAPWLERAASSYGGSLNGIPRGVDRVRALGNAVVPPVAEIVGRAILQAERLAA